MEAYLFDCQVAGLEPAELKGCRSVLCSFIRFTGDIQVQQMTPDHIRMYIANLSDGPYLEREHEEIVMSHYAVIQTWIHWMYVQKYLIERDGGSVKPPALSSLIPSRITWSLAHYWRYPLSI